MRISESRSAPLLESTNRRSKISPQITAKRKLRTRPDSFSAWESQNEKKWQCDLTDWFEERRLSSKKVSDKAVDDHEEIRFRPLPRCAYMEELHYKQKAAAAAAAWEMEAARRKQQEEVEAAIAAHALSTISTNETSPTLLDDNNKVELIEEVEVEVAHISDEDNDKRFSLVSNSDAPILYSRKLWTTDNSLQWRERQEVLQLHKMSSTNNLQQNSAPQVTTTQTPRFSYTNRETTKLCANFHMQRSKSSLIVSGLNKAGSSTNENQSQFISLVPAKISLLEECLRYNNTAIGGRSALNGAADNISTLLSDYGIQTGYFTVLRTKIPSSAPSTREPTVQNDTHALKSGPKNNFTKKSKESSSSTPPINTKLLSTRNIQPQLPIAEASDVLLCKAWRGFGQSEITNKLGNILREKVTR